MLSNDIHSPMIIAVNCQDPKSKENKTTQNRTAQYSTVSNLEDK